MSDDITRYEAVVRTDEGSESIIESADEEKVDRCISKLKKSKVAGTIVKHTKLYRCISTTPHIV